MDPQKPNFMKRPLYRRMERNGDLTRLTASIRGVLEDAGLRDRMKAWTTNVLKTENPKMFNKDSMREKLVRTSVAAIDVSILKKEVSKRFTPTPSSSCPTKRREASSSSARQSGSRKRTRSSTDDTPKYSKAYRYN